jgi:hypothetical protein
LYPNSFSIFCTHQRWPPHTQPRPLSPVLPPPPLVGLHPGPGDHPSEPTLRAPARSIPDPQVGRPKSQRWSDASPDSSGDSCLAPHSYKEALLATPTNHVASTPVTTEKQASEEKTVVGSRPEVQSRLVPQRLGKDGWQVVQCRSKFHGDHLPRRWSHVDLRGKCYNCFSSTHLVVTCRRPTRCFKCYKLGHQAAGCPSLPVAAKKNSVWQRLSNQSERASVWQRLAGQQKHPPPFAADSHRRRSVWRRINTPLEPALKEDTSRMFAAGDSQRSLRNKKKRRSKRGKGSLMPGAGPGSMSPVSSDNVEAPRKVHMPALRSGGQMEIFKKTLPSCVLKFTTEMAREEVTLRRALFVTVVGTRPEVLGVEVLEEVAHNFDVNIEAMWIHQVLPEDFLLILPDEENASMVLNDGKAYRGAHFSLKFKRWSRFTHASSTIMSGMVEVEIRGIPEHAWFRSTAANILRDSCWISEVHPDTLQKKDYSSFRVSAWCFDPGRLHRVMDLHIVEPGLHTLEKRCLTYKISVSATQTDLLAADMGPPPPPPPAYGRRPDGDGGGGEDQDPQSRRSSGSQFQRRPVHLRLGPQLSLGRGAATLVPRAALPAPSRTSGGETSNPERDPERDALSSLRIEETPVSEEPQEDREVPEAVIEGQISPGKINSPRCHLIAACDRTVETVLVDMSIGEQTEPGSPRSLNGPREMA